MGPGGQSVEFGLFSPSSGPIPESQYCVWSLALRCPDFSSADLLLGAPASRLLFPSFSPDISYGCGGCLPNACHLRRFLFYLLTHSLDTRFHVCNLLLPIFFTRVLLSMSALRSFAPDGTACVSPS